MMLPSAVAGELLGRAARHDFVKQSLLVTVLAQEPAEALDVLPGAAGAGEDNANVGGWDVHALVENLAGDEDGVFARVEALQDLAAFLCLGLIGDRRDEEAA